MSHQALRDKNDQQEIPFYKAILVALGVYFLEASVEETTKPTAAIADPTQYVIEKVKIYYRKATHFDLPDSYIQTIVLREFSGQANLKERWDNRAFSSLLVHEQKESVLRLVLNAHFQETSYSSHHDTLPSWVDDVLAEIGWGLGLDGTFLANLVTNLLQARVNRQKLLRGTRRTSALMTATADDSVKSLDQRLGIYLERKGMAGEFFISGILPSSIFKDTDLAGMRVADAHQSNERDWQTHGRHSGRIERQHCRIRNRSS